MKPFICKRCGVEQERTTPQQRLCAACKAIRKEECAAMARERERRRRSIQPKVCAKCGRALDDYRKTYCSICAAPKGTSELDLEISEEYRKAEQRKQRMRSSSCTLAGKSLEEINQMARDCGMSYGKFVEWVRARGTLPPRRRSEMEQ